MATEDYYHNQGTSYASVPPQSYIPSEPGAYEIRPRGHEMVWIKVLLAANNR